MKLLLGLLMHQEILGKCLKWAYLRKKRRVREQIVERTNYCKGQSYFCLDKFCIDYFVHVTLKTGFSCNSQLTVSRSPGLHRHDRSSLHLDPFRKDRASGERKPDYFHTCITMFDDYTTFDARIPFVPFTGVFLGSFLARGTIPFIDC